MSNLSSQANRPTLKNVGFMQAAAPFSKNQGFGSKDALDVIGGSLGLVLGALGGFLEPSSPLFSAQAASRALRSGLRSSLGG